MRDAGSNMPPWVISVVFICSPGNHDVQKEKEVPPGSVRSAILWMLLRNRYEKFTFGVFKVEGTIRQYRVVQIER